jgi:hypothetical protein
VANALGNKGGISVSTLMPLLFLWGCAEIEDSFGHTFWRAPGQAEASSEWVVDESVVTGANSVDVLFAIDNGCSMLEEQQALAENFPLFSNYFVDSGLDWHLGVVSLDMDDPSRQGRLRSANGVNYIDGSVPDVVGTFKEMAAIGTSGSDAPQGRNAVYSAIELLKNKENAGFMREDTPLEIILISDQDDYSDNDLVSLTEFIEWLLHLKMTPEMVGFSSLVGPPASCTGAVETGDEYLAVTNQVGGVKWSICSQDWALLLDELGLQATGLRDHHSLTQRPRVDTLSLTVEWDGNTRAFEFWDGNQWSLDHLEDVFTYDPIRNSVQFEDYVPDSGARVKVGYEVMAVGGGGEDAAR